VDFTEVVVAAELLAEAASALIALGALAMVPVGVVWAAQAVLDFIRG
jgi:hypothetical protein